MHNVLNLYSLDTFHLFVHHCSKSSSNVCVRPVTYSNLNIYNDSFTTNGSAR